MEFKSFTSVAVANQLVRMSNAAPKPDMNATKLQELTYIAHGWHLGLTGKSLLSDRVRATHDGVFCVDLREAGCWGTRRITDLIQQIQMDPEKGVMIERTPMLPDRHPVLRIIDRVWEIWGKASAYDLRNFTREVGAPWDLIWNDEDRPDDEPQIIPNGTIRLWFRDYVENEERKAALARRHRRHLGDTQQLLAAPDPDRLRVV